MNINENIKNFRTFRGIKQQDLADQLGRSKSVISNWERGENSPDLDSCEKLCKILRVTPNQLFGWEKNEEYEAWRERITQTEIEIREIRNQIDSYQEKLRKLEKKKSALEGPIDDTEYSLFDMFDEMTYEEYLKRNKSKDKK